MSEFLVKGKHFTRKHVWFQNAEDCQNTKDCDILVVYGNPVPVDKIGKNKCHCEPQKTGVSDLTKPEEELFRLVNSSIRNSVNRCRRENVEVVVYHQEEEILPVLDDFAEMYHGMFLEKGMPDRYLPLEELKVYAKSGALVISTAVINGQAVQYHAYIVDHSHSRFLFSCSHFRAVEKDLKQAIGRANDYLHWMDFLYLKERGISAYDWGGLTSFENPNGIDRFKMKFGLEFREYYNITCVCSPGAKVYSQVRKLLKKH